MMDDNEKLRSMIEIHLTESAQVKQATITACQSSILCAVDLLVVALRSGFKVLLCGNGGSAADCQHLAAEFVNRLTASFVRPPLPAIALTTDSSFLTAYANDVGFDGVYERQVMALGKSGDVLLGISTSGNSKNILRAVQTAKELCIHTVVLTGRQGSLIGLADIAIAVPSDHTQYIQETHLAIEHILCELVETRLFLDEKSDKTQKPKMSEE